MGSGETVPARCEGIYTFSFDPASGTLKKESVCTRAVNPSWVEPFPGRPYLYAVSELKTYADTEGSVVSAYRINPETGELTFLNQQVSAGADACHLVLSPNGKYLICSNYSGGSFSVFPIHEDYSLAPMSCLVRHSGHGTNPQRQEGPHVHQGLISPDGKHVYFSDLGLDRLVCYDADWESGVLARSDFPNISCLPGQGARHALFNREGTYLYQMTEMACEVNVYRYDAASGKAQMVQTVRALEEGVSPEGSLGAAIHLHPSGKWLYVSVRGTSSGYDRLAVFTVCKDGLLKLCQILYAGGSIPRDFSLTEDGNWLLCGTSESDAITVYAVSRTEGTLKEHSRTDQAGGVTRVALWNSAE